MINEIDSEATIGDQVVNVSARLQIEILGEGWVTVPLRLRNAAIRSATIGDAAARIVFDPEAGYQLLYQKQGEPAGATGAAAGVHACVYEDAGAEQRRVRGSTSTDQPLADPRS